MSITLIENDVLRERVEFSKEVALEMFRELARLQGKVLDKEACDKLRRMCIDIYDGNRGREGPTASRQAARGTR